MKRLFSLAALAPLAAQSPTFGLQLGFGQTRPVALDLASSTGTLSVDPAAQQAATLRGLAAWKPAPGWTLEASLGFRPSSGGTLEYRSSSAGAGRLDVTQTLASQMILGGLVLCDLRERWFFCLGLDLRAERLAAETAQGSSAASLTRPWLRAAVRCAWTGAWKPFVALEYAAPLSRPSTAAADYIQDLDRLGTASNPATGSVAKAHAPASELLLAVGLRFPGRRQ